MSDYYTQSMRALQLAGMSDSTQECYTRAVRQLAQFYDKLPAEISEVELEEYFLHRKNVTGWSAATLRIAQAGIKFFFLHVLRRDWHLFQFLSAKKERRLPCILSRDEVFRVLGCVRTGYSFVFLATVYGCGLRLSEARHLEVADVDSQRRMLHVHRGKGAKDRLVPLPTDTLRWLRQYWKSHRHPTLLFPAVRRRRHQPHAATPIGVRTVQDALRLACQAAGIHKRRVTPHTLRHCYATHLLEAGVNPHLIQRYMGHTSLETTMMYFHLTQKGTEDAYRIIDAAMRGFDHDDDR